jgi:hypothetical protein
MLLFFHLTEDTEKIKNPESEYTDPGSNPGTDRIQTRYWIWQQVPVLLVKCSSMKTISKVSALTHRSQQIGSGRNTADLFLKVTRFVSRLGHRQY